MPSRMAERDSSDMECDEEATFGESRSVVAGFQAVMSPGAADVSLETMTVDDAAFCTVWGVESRMKNAGCLSTVGGRPIVRSAARLAQRLDDRGSCWRKQHPCHCCP